MVSYTTNLNQPPYFDNFDQSKQYYRWLFKPGVAIQTREMAGIQAMLQDQISKFGRNIYKEGSVVEGIKPFKFDYNNLYYVKIADTFANGSALNSQLISLVSSPSSNTAANTTSYYLVNQNNLTAIVVSAQLGSIATAPNTNVLFVKYINTAQYANSNVSAGVINSQFQFDSGDSLKVVNCTPATLNVALGNTTWLTSNIAVVSNTTFPTVGNVVGKSYAMHVSSGVIFHKGTFVYVPDQDVIVSPFSGAPDNLSIGFNSVETLITADVDSSLLDNADGSPNFAAPGADALQIVPYLSVVNTAAVVNSSTFFSLVDFKYGNPTTILDLPQYSTIGLEFARRTYETNGDFVVKPFVLYTTPLDPANTASNTYVNINTDKGLGYIEGFRVEHPNKISTILRRGNDFANAAGQIVTANYGYYVDVKEMAGSFMANNNVVQVELHNVAKTAMSSGTLLSTSYSATTKIGTAYVKGFDWDYIDPTSGANTQYRAYLFNVQMNAGFSFKDAKSIINNTSGVLGVGDIVQTFSATSNGNVAQIQDPFVNQMVFPLGQKAIKLDGFKNMSYVYRYKQSVTMNSSSGASISVMANTQGTATETFNYGPGSLSSLQKQDFVVVATSAGQTANQSGTITTNASSTTVTGSSTSFLTQYNIGDWIAIYSLASPEIKLITGITNNTVLTVSQNLTSTNTGVAHAMNYPVGHIINFPSRTARTITIGSPANTATISMGQTLATTFNVDVWSPVKRTGTVPAAKVINKNVYVKIDCSNNAANNTGPWCLGLSDVFSIDAVWIGTAGAYSNTGTNVVSNFSLDNGQRDSHYDLAYISAKNNNLTPTSTILVQLSYFSRNYSQGVGYLTGNSYPVDLSGNTANTNAVTISHIPFFTTQKGTVFDLRDCVDFRPMASNNATGSTTVAGASINPATTVSFANNSQINLPFLPHPDSGLTTDVQYFIPRVDRCVMDINGNIQIVEGVASIINPQPPDEPTNTMTLGLISVPPYPSLSTPEAKIVNRYDYAISCQMQQNRRYTMRDIGVLDKRITNVEYYTSLNLLEASAQKLLVRNNNTGQNRFRNGMFVDPFNGFDLSNTNDPTFNIAIDSGRSELRPRFSQKRSDLTFDATNSTGCAQFGELIMLNHTANNAYISQPFASKYRNCIDGNVYEWKGSITLTPWGTLSPDLSTLPDVVNNIDLASNWVNLGQSAFGTQWGNWVDTSSTSTSNTNTTTQTNVDGSTTSTTVNQTVTTQAQQRSGQQLSVQTTQNQYNLGTYVANISLLPYLKPARIKFVATGMKPNTRVYPFFGNQPVSAVCSPTRSDFTYTNINNDVYSGVYNNALITDSSGNLYGFFYIPQNTFRSQEIIFQLVDVSNLITGASAISTSASATFYGSRLAFSTSSSILNTREAVINVNEVTDNRTLSGSNTTITTTTVPPLSPWNPPPWNPGPGPDGGGGGSSDPGGDSCGCGDTGGGDGTGGDGGGGVGD